MSAYDWDNQPTEADEAEAAAVEAQLAHNRAVRDEVEKQRIRRDATALLRAETQPDRPQMVALSDFLAVPDEPMAERIEELQPVGGRITVIAERKKGKTTVVGNLVRCLADGDDFLDAFKVHPPEGRIILIDVELDKRMLRRWLRDHHVVNEDRVVVLPMRGNVGALNLLDESTLREWAADLQKMNAGYVILDCMRPVLDALGLDENHDAGRFLVAFDALLKQAGAGEGAVVHHSGHNGDRARGDSRIRDWPDAEWTIRGDGNQDDPLTGPRYFHAEGRDVHVRPSLLAYDPATRRLSYTGSSRQDVAYSATVPRIVEYVGANPGQSGNAIEDALTATGLPRADVRAARKQALANGLVKIIPGKQRAQLHYLPNEYAEVRQGHAGALSSKYAATPIGGVLLTHSNEPSTPPAHSLLGQLLGPACGWCHVTGGHDADCPNKAVAS